MGSIYDFVKTQRDNYRSQTIEIAEGYEYSQYQTLRTIELYHNSKFETGKFDSLKREKPFYNIIKFRVSLATRDLSVPPAFRLVEIRDRHAAFRKTCGDFKRPAERFDIAAQIAHVDVRPALELGDRRLAQLQLPRSHQLHGSSKSDARRHREAHESASPRRLHLR